MRYAPERVLIIEDSGYTELSYEEFCRRKETDLCYKDKLLIPLHGMIMEVSKADYDDFYQKERRQKYIDERAEKNKDVSYDVLSTDGFNGESILIDDREDVATQVEHKIILDKLRMALQLLSGEEKQVIRALFFEEMTEREYAAKEGVCRNAIHKRKVRILTKLKKIMEN